MSWDQLRSIFKDSIKDIEKQRITPPIACPNDGTLLEKNPRTGKLQCKFDGWVYEPGSPNPV